MGSTTDKVDFAKVKAKAVLEISEARKWIGSLAKMLQSRPVIRVQRHRKDAFCVVDVGYFESLIETMDILSDPSSLTMLEDSLADIRAGRVVDFEDVKDDL